MRMLRTIRSLDIELNAPSCLTAANNRGARPLAAIRKSTAPSTMRVSSPQSEPPDARGRSCNRNYDCQAIDKKALRKRRDGQILRAHAVDAVDETVRSGSSIATRNRLTPNWRAR